MQIEFYKWSLYFKSLIQLSNISKNNKIKIKCNINLQNRTLEANLLLMIQITLKM